MKDEKSPFLSLQRHGLLGIKLFSQSAIKTNGYECPLPRELKELVFDYSCGSVLYWQHWFHDVLCDIQKIYRPDDTPNTYYKRTRIAHFGLTEYKCTDHTFSHKLSNIIYEALEDILPEYDTTTEDGNEMMQLIFEYTGWYYGFRLASERKLICYVSTYF